MTNTAKKKADHLPDFDPKETLDRIRERYGSVAEYLRQEELTPQTFYASIRGERGHTRKRSKAVQIIHRLAEQGLLVKVKAA